jgi:predicted RNA-binding Zn-ribbon protein involved in translation (DUF1610 family)
MIAAWLPAAAAAAGRSLKSRIEEVDAAVMGLKRAQVHAWDGARAQSEPVEDAEQEPRTGGVLGALAGLGSRVRASSRRHGARGRAAAASRYQGAGHDHPAEDGRHIWAKQRHHLYTERAMQHSHVHGTAAWDGVTAYCLWAAGLGALTGAHWWFLAAKARTQRARTHAHGPQARVSQHVPAFGKQVVVFVEPPPPHLGCTLCGRVAMHDPSGIDFTLGKQSVPCTHAFCRACLVEKLKTSWGCPTCGDNPVWRVETRWKGTDEIVEARPEITTGEGQPSACTVLWDDTGGRADMMRSSL